MKSPLCRPRFNACWCKNTYRGYYEPPRWPLFSWSEDNYRTHDLWIFIKPRPCLYSFKQIHYWVASLPARQAACQPVSQPISTFNNSNGRAARQSRGRPSGSRDGVSGEFLARDRIPESIYFHSRFLYRGPGHFVKRAGCWWITSGSVHHKTEGRDINTAGKDERVSF